jgi:hypothetical protein
VAWGVWWFGKLWASEWKVTPAELAESAPGYRHLPILDGEKKEGEDDD